MYLQKQTCPSSFLLRYVFFAAERQRGSTLFLTTPANRFLHPVFHATYVSSRISISVIRCGCRFSGGGMLLAKQGGPSKNIDIDMRTHLHSISMCSSAYYLCLCAVLCDIISAWTEIVRKLSEIYR